MFRNHGLDSNHDHQLSRKAPLVAPMVMQPPTHTSNDSPDHSSIASSVSVADNSPYTPQMTPTNESPMRSPSESSLSSVSRVPSSSSSRSSRSYASPSRSDGISASATFSRYHSEQWSNGHTTNATSRALVDPAATTPSAVASDTILSRNPNKNKRPLHGASGGGAISTKRQRIVKQRMNEQLFQHTSRLLYRATLENDTRASELDEEAWRQTQKREKYERKVRSLQRELAQLDPEAAAAYARGELRAQSPTPTSSVASRSTAEDQVMSLHGSSVRKSLQDRRELFSKFQSTVLNTCSQSHPTSSA